MEFHYDGPDFSNPTVIGNSPTGNNEPITARITVNFNEAMNQTSVESALLASLI